MFCYKVKFWDDFDEVTKELNGLLSAEDYGSAANRIIDYYGKENVITLMLEEIDSPIEQEDIEHLFEEF